MNYEIAFYALLAFIIGRNLPKKVYIGNDVVKYKAADCGILLRK
jgi:hypothetical protein